MTIRHLVLLAFKESTTQEDINNIMADLENCTKEILGANFGCACKYSSPNNKAFTHYFFIDFETTEARDAYLKNPIHNKIATEQIIPKLSAAPDSAVVVFDYAKPPKQKAQYIPQNSATSGNYIFFRSDAPDDHTPLKDKLLQDIQNEGMNIKKYKFKDNCTIETLDQGFKDAVIIKLSELNTDLKLNSPHLNSTNSLLFKKAHARVNVDSKQATPTPSPSLS